MTRRAAGTPGRSGALRAVVGAHFGCPRDVRQRGPVRNVGFMRRPITLTARGTKVLATVAAGALAFTLATGCENSAPPPNDQDQEQEQENGNQPGGGQQERDQDQPEGNQQEENQDND